MSRYLDEDGLQIVADKVNKKIGTVTEIPQNPSDGQVIVYVGETDNYWIKGHVYKFDAAKTVNLTVQTSDTETTGYILYTKVSNMPVTSEGWIFKSTDDEDKLIELIQGDYQFEVDSVGNDFDFQIFPEWDPIVIGASYNALHISYADGVTPSQQELTFGITYGNDWWVDITEDGTRAATDAMNSIASKKNDLFQYEYLPNAKGSFLNKIVQELQNGYFYKCNPVGEQTNITTDNQFRSYLSSYGENIIVVAEPYAGQSGSVLIDGYQYFINYVTGSGVMKTATDIFLTRIDIFDFSQPCEIVSVEEIQDLGLSMYSDFEWEQIVMPDEEARETAAGAMALAESVSDKATAIEQNMALYNSYSFDEKWTGGTWVDGKKIYKKTYDLGTVPSPSGSSVYCRIPFTVDFDTVVEIKGMIVPNENTTQAQIEYYSIPKPPKVGGSDYNVSLKIKPYNNVLNLELETKNELNNKKAYATVYYTKINN